MTRLLESEHLDNSRAVALSVSICDADTAGSNTSSPATKQSAENIQIAQFALVPSRMIAAKCSSVERGGHSLLAHWQDGFLYHLRRKGKVDLSCQLAGIDRSTAYYHYGKNREFKRAWDAAISFYRQNNIRRSMVGTR